MMKNQKIKQILREAISSEKENMMKVTVHMYPSLRQFLLHSQSPPTAIPKKTPLTSHHGNIMMPPVPPRQQQLSEELFGPYKMHVQDFFKKLKSLGSSTEEGIPSFIESFSLSTDVHGKKTKYDLIVLTSSAIEQGQRELFPFFQKFPTHHFLLAVLLKNEKVVHVDSISLPKNLFSKKHSK
jgi:hypothetical protein